VKISPPTPVVAVEINSENGQLNLVEVNEIPKEAIFAMNENPMRTINHQNETIFANRKRSGIPQNSTLSMEKGIVNLSDY